MKLIETTVALAKADGEIDIGDAGLDTMARKLVALANDAGWDRKAFIRRLLDELMGADFASDMTAWRARQS